MIGVGVRRLSSNEAKTKRCAGTSTKDQVYSQTLNYANALAIMRDPSELVSISRRYAQRLSAKCQAGYTLAKYVSCSRILCRCIHSKCCCLRLTAPVVADRLSTDKRRRYPYQCQSSGGWMIKNCAVRSEAAFASDPLGDDVRPTEVSHASAVGEHSAAR